METKKKNLKNNYDCDILFLEERMKTLIHFEEYEKCARIKIWIDQLKEKQEKDGK